jgi:hypothetical protein
MSSYRTQTLAMQAAAGDAVCAHLGADVVDMARLAQARDALLAATDATSAQEVLTGLHPLVRSTLETVAPAAWEDLSAALADGVDATAQARQAFAAADQAYGRAARDVLVDTLLAFAGQPAQGFVTVTPEVGEHVAAVYAVRDGGAERVMFVVDDAGQLRQEYAGHGGVSCEVRAAELAAFAAQRGIVLSTTEHVPVRDERDDGVRLIRAATQSNRDNPAAGLVQSLEARRSARTGGIFGEQATARTRTAATRVRGAK